MHKNTILFIILLALCSVFIATINIIRITSQPEQKVAVTTPLPTSAPTQIPSPTPTPELVESTRSASLSGTKKLTPTPLPQGKQTITTPCGLSLYLPATYAAESNQNGTTIINTAPPQEMVVVTCEKNVFTPSVPKEQTETRTLKGGVTATLYHDTSSTDGSPIDAVVFRHPKTGNEVLIVDSGTTIDTILSSITVIQ